MGTLPSVHVIGGGLAGTECAWQIACHGVPVTLYEMRPRRLSPAHHTDQLAELVCSNSFGALATDRAPGLLKEELHRLGSLVITAANQFAVPAGGALAVDRILFGEYLTRTVAQHPQITLCREEVTRIPEAGIVVLATGPLTSQPLAEHLRDFTGAEYLSFFDAASPIVEGESLDRNLAYLASRYDRGEAAYLNCPMNEAEYHAFWSALTTAEQAELKEFEQAERKFFEGCLPVEEIARRGYDALRFGPLKPVGLLDPRTGQRPFAVVQLRAEDRGGRLWNLVGFQTNLKWAEQKRVFSLIPGLAEASFVRLGVMHRNTFLAAPHLLGATLQFHKEPRLLACGQITGTEGYTAAVAGGWLAGTNAARLALGEEPLCLPSVTMAGALIQYIITANVKHFQPMPPNFAILPEMEPKIRNKMQRYGGYRDRSLQALAEFQRSLQPAPFNYFQGIR
ncbi:FADH(2)-oxidizing methylenetetrahydrofolate--tRNA-(uracil(54)-C(5))-methyltransferase TrmFO [Anthocerotibacter panamensis]|uniref:FADH(2)-oxidizing methylenetetrahydrofolate--tRNA-(uracil(54)-C(5))- methyltransferase TrmFO n=1 Tax=Anthocerotibacter panamensis TaxID=2857077 RepID=UPI001C4057D4|nr:FADH(2)-oxidizing methylenetetrahydrofolate--tRNA-(uracil(54)-C(5))-methyltransferase TrmFO [Anthocerotibacter panamensis]